MSGIINWALEGLFRLVKKGFKFSRSVRTEEMWRKYRIKSNPISSFIESCLEYTGFEGDVLEKDNVYEHYNKWAKNNGVNPLSRNEFFKRLKNEGLDSRQSKKIRYEEGLLRMADKNGMI
ncbi:MAG: primase-like DNA-binding domain-containing protein [Candidatus Bathyarchaeia archaeon]